MKRILFASIATLFVISPAFAAPPPPPVPQWTVFIEGGGFWDNHNDVGFLGAAGTSNKFGGQGAAGFDYRFDPLWHVSAQFRYSGNTSSSFVGDVNTQANPFICDPRATSCTIGLSAATLGIEQRKFVADASIGRDIVFGPGITQAKIGFRYADIQMISTLTGGVGGFAAYAAANGAGSTSTVSVTTGSASSSASGGVGGTFAAANIFAGANFFRQISQYSGVGPRASIEGEIPFSTGWSVDYSAGTAVLFGQSKSALGSSVASVSGTGSFGASDARQLTVLNTDGSAGISYWFTPGVKATLGYRVDAYFDALRIGNPGDATAHYVDHGPFGRLTAKF